MMLTTKGRYAVMAMVDMAMQNRFLPESQKAVCLGEIAERQDITVAYLEQIFSKLKCAGLVKSVRGPGGGYMLARPVEETCISEIIQAVDEKIKMVRCGDKPSSSCGSHKGKCATHDLWDGLGKQIDNYLRSVTLMDIINKSSFKEGNGKEGLNC